MRLELVPIRRAGVIIRAVVVVTMLNGHADRFAEVDRILYMETIQGNLPAPVGPAGSGFLLIPTQKAHHSQLRIGMGELPGKENHSDICSEYKRTKS